MTKPLVTCLTATYGRISKLSEAVSCFVNQDYENKKLVILNNHPAPLTCDLPGVEIYNEPIYPTLGDCRNRLIDLADGEFIRTWDDDDLYMPWTISQGVDHIGEAIAWKPKRSWFWVKEHGPKLAENVFEASILIKTWVAKKYKYLPGSGGNEHETLCNGMDKEGGCQNTDVGMKASYVYRWGWGMWHISGSLGSSTIEKRTKDWVDKNNDVQDGIIKVVDLKKYWSYFPMSFD